MLRLKHVNKFRAFLSPQATLDNYFPFSTSTTPSSIGQSLSLHGILKYDAKEIVGSFKTWFKSRKNPLFDRIYEILGTQIDESIDSSDFALSQLGLRLSEEFVLEVLEYGKDVLSCLKFFDWAGRQHGFHHTRATFNAIFKILSRAKLMSLMLDFLETYRKQRYAHRVRFYGTLVMGYAVAGKPEIALQLFGRMRFQGLDLDDFSYHVLLNALVEDSSFDGVDVIFKQIQMRGYDKVITHSIMMKSFCKQNRLDEAEAFLDGLLNSGKTLNGVEVGFLIGALCKSKKFKRAEQLLQELQQRGFIPMEHAYNVWIRNLVRAGNLDEALEFFRDKSLEGYVPDVFRYNFLICKLLRENWLEEACLLLVEMKENQIFPDKVTMNAALCLFCKAGMVDAALELYNSRSEFGLSPNSMAYNYLINTLCGDGSIDEAYHVLRSSIDQGCFLGKKTFSILADALCRERKIDKMKELMVAALERNIMLSTSTYGKFITALCNARRVQDAYLIHEELNRLNIGTTECTYRNLILGFNQSNRGDIAARLLLEMQEKGHTAPRNLFRAVTSSLCDTGHLETQFFKLLEMQLSRDEPSCYIYNLFIEGAGWAKKPDLARKVYEMMTRNMVTPNLSSDILMLQSYLKSGRISEALNFFNEVRQRRKIGRKLYNTMLVGLCKADKTDISLEFLKEMRKNGVTPSIECYEVLVQSLCSEKRYYEVVDLVNDYEKVRHQITSFIGNILLLHSLRGPELYDAWIRLRGVENEESSPSARLGLLIGAFSGRIEVNHHIDNLEEVIEKCFPLDTYTYNMLLRRVSMSDMNLACELFNRMRQRGYVPNMWTYDILVQGFSKHGRKAEANYWAEEMFQQGFYPTAYS